MELSVLVNKLRLRLVSSDKLKQEQSPPRWFVVYNTIPSSCLSCFRWMCVYFPPSLKCAHETFVSFVPSLFVSSFSSCDDPISVSFPGHCHLHSHERRSTIFARGPARMLVTTYGRCGSRCRWRCLLSFFLATHAVCLLAVTSSQESKFTYIYHSLVLHLRRNQ